MMKTWLITLLLIFIAFPVLSAPNYDPNLKPVTYDKEMYNIKLRNSLEDEYDKKCFVQISQNEVIHICGENAYYNMVLEPYIRQKKNFD